MPTYDYECDACGHKFEKFQPITSAPVRKCPQCKKNKVRRLIGAGAGIIFKGSGFYATDYRSDSYRKGADKDKPASAVAAAPAPASAASSSAPASSSKDAAAKPASSSDQAGGKQKKKG